MNLIRVDSCRKCGEELQVTKRCIDCNQPLHFECNNCNAFVDDHIHQHENLLHSLFSFSEELMMERNMSINDTGVLTA